MSRDVTIAADIAERALTAAAHTATRAPSIHNTQPWHWRISGHTADLFAVPERTLPIGDPERRMLMTSCGAALHHACVALSAEGMAHEIERMPDPNDANHLARLTVTGHNQVVPAAMRLFQATAIRRTDRRPLLDQPIDSSVLDVLRAAVTAYGVGIDPLNSDQTLTLAGAIDLAQRDQLGDPEARAELEAWTGERRGKGTGVPDANIPATPNPTTVPSRDFGRAGSLDVPDRHDSAATYAILYGLDDDPVSWLRAGEALSALWLAATQHDVAVLPLSAAVEQASTRLILRRLLGGVGYPYLAVRLGIADQLQPPPERTPRLPDSTTIEVLAESTFPGGTGADGESPEPEEES